MARGGKYPTYFSPEGLIISRDWYMAEKAKTPDPYLIRQFENERVSLQLRHSETIRDARNIPKNFWQMFRVEIINIVKTDSEGQPIAEIRTPDPDSKGYCHREDAEKSYDLFLAKYTESHFDAEDGKLVEVGNMLAPPDPDIPTMPVESFAASEFGSW